MKIPHLTSLGALALALPLTQTFAYEAITSYGVPSGIELNGSNQIIDNDIPVTSITTASGTYSGFIGPTEAHQAGSAPSFTTYGFTDTEVTTSSVALLGNNLAQSIVNGGGLTYNVMFGQTITDDTNGTDTNFEIFYIELLASNEPYLLRAITGDTASAPIIGNSTDTISSVTTASDGPTISGALVRRGDNGSTLAATYGGHAFDLSDAFGVTSIIGIQIVSISGSADPAAILAIPEPASLALGLSSMAALFVFSRRRR